MVISVTDGGSGTYADGRKVTYRGNRQLGVEPCKLPAPAADEVQIAVAFTGICGTDLHIFHGEMDARVNPPAVLGHEMSGRIAAVGDEVAGWQIGQPVTVMPTRACGSCPACERGLAHVCHELGVIGVDWPGSMQTRWNVPAELVVALPGDLPLERAALVEPVAVAVHDVRRARVRPDEYVVVVGGGPIGQLIALVSQYAGARVLLMELDPARRAIAEANGIEAIDPRVDDPASTVNRRTDGAGADVAFEVSGAPAGVATTVDVLARRGRLVMVAIHSRPREMDLFQFFWRELEMVGARLYQRGDFDEAVRLVASAAIPVQSLISRVESFETASAAFDTLEGGGVMKVLVDCQGGAR